MMKRQRSFSNRHQKRQTLEGNELLNTLNKLSIKAKDKNKIKNKSKNKKTKNKFNIGNNNNNNNSNKNLTIVLSNNNGQVNNISKTQKNITNGGLKVDNNGNEETPMTTKSKSKSKNSSTDVGIGMALNLKLNQFENSNPSILSNSSDNTNIPRMTVTSHSRHTPQVSDSMLLPVLPTLHTRRTNDVQVAIGLENQNESTGNININVNTSGYHTASSTMLLDPNITPASPPRNIRSRAGVSTGAGTGGASAGAGPGGHGLSKFVKMPGYARVDSGDEFRSPTRPELTVIASNGDDDNDDDVTVNTPDFITNQFDNLQKNNINKLNKNNVNKNTSISMDSELTTITGTSEEDNSNENSKMSGINVNLNLIATAPNSTRTLRPQMLMGSGQTGQDGTTQNGLEIFPHHSPLISAATFGDAYTPRSTQLGSFDDSIESFGDVKVLPQNSMNNRNGDGDGNDNHNHNQNENENQNNNEHLNHNRLVNSNSGKSQNVDELFIKNSNVGVKKMRNHISGQMSFIDFAMKINILDEEELDDVELNDIFQDMSAVLEGKRNAYNTDTNDLKVEKSNVNESGKKRTNENSSDDSIEIVNTPSTVIRPILQNADSNNSSKIGSNVTQDTIDILHMATVDNIDINDNKDSKESKDKNGSDGNNGSKGARESGSRITITKLYESDEEQEIERDVFRLPSIPEATSNINKNFDSKIPLQRENTDPSLSQQSLSNASSAMAVGIPSEYRPSSVSPVLSSPPPVATDVEANGKDVIVFDEKGHGENGKFKNIMIEINSDIGDSYPKLPGDNSDSNHNNNNNDNIPKAGRSTPSEQLMSDIISFPTIKPQQIEMSHNVKMTNNQSNKSVKSNQSNGSLKSLHLKHGLTEKNLGKHNKQQAPKMAKQLSNDSKLKQDLRIVTGAQDAHNDDDNDNNNNNGKNGIGKSKNNPEYSLGNNRTNINMVDAVNELTPLTPDNKDDHNAALETRFSNLAGKIKISMAGINDNDNTNTINSQNKHISQSSRQSQMSVGSQKRRSRLFNWFDNEKSKRPSNLSTVGHPGTTASRLLGALTPISFGKRVSVSLGWSNASAPGNDVQKADDLEAGLNNNENGNKGSSKGLTVPDGGNGGKHHSSQLSRLTENSNENLNEIAGMLDNEDQAYVNAFLNPTFWNAMVPSQSQTQSKADNRRIYGNNSDSNDSDIDSINNIQEDAFIRRRKRSRLRQRSAGKKARRLKPSKIQINNLSIGNNTTENDDDGDGVGGSGNVNSEDYYQGYHPLSRNVERKKDNINASNKHRYPRHPKYYKVSQFIHELKIPLTPFSSPIVSPTTVTDSVANSPPSLDLLSMLPAKLTPSALLSNNGTGYATGNKRHTLAQSWNPTNYKPPKYNDIDGKHKNCDDESDSSNLPKFELRVTDSNHNVNVINHRPMLSDHGSTKATDFYKLTNNTSNRSNSSDSEFKEESPDIIKTAMQSLRPQLGVNNDANTIGATLSVANAARAVTIKTDRTPVPEIGILTLHSAASSIVDSNKQFTSISSNATKSKVKRKATAIKSKSKIRSKKSGNKFNNNSIPKYNSNKHKDTENEEQAVAAESQLQHHYTGHQNSGLDTKNLLSKLEFWSKKQERAMERMKANQGDNDNFKGNVNEIDNTNDLFGRIFGITTIASNNDNLGVAEVDVPFYSSDDFDEEKAISPFYNKQNNRNKNINKSKQDRIKNRNKFEKTDRTPIEGTKAAVKRQATRGRNQMNREYGISNDNNSDSGGIGGGISFSSSEVLTDSSSSHGGYFDVGYNNFGGIHSGTRPRGVARRGRVRERERERDRDRERELDISRDYSQMNSSVDADYETNQLYDADDNDSGDTDFDAKNGGDNIANGSDNDNGGNGNGNPKQMNQWNCVQIANYIASIDSRMAVYKDNIVESKVIGQNIIDIVNQRSINNNNVDNKKNNNCTTSTNYILSIGKLLNIEMIDESHKMIIGVILKTLVLMNAKRGDGINTSKNSGNRVNGRKYKNHLV